ncbi:MAG TPA: Glu/Leu/Phe/Val dehydrogenase dimerization domain-containing protein [Thermoleophilaceae bacterium]|nr:Glu/Leu/Phe/Val dehydrogenase dimerization domain-containing protein [Thermoleophilaceae bacterium]
MTITVEPADPPISIASAPQADDRHEQVVVRQDPATGMRLIVAVHSTVLGPALGGLRLLAYPGGLRDAFDDVLALARTMTLKASAAGLDLGGGKAVMIDDGEEGLRRRRFEEAALVVDSLAGAYITAEDIGTTTADMDVMAERTPYVVGRSRDRGGFGDPSPTTAATVFGSIRRGLLAALGSGDLEGRRIGVVGLGKVGGVLAARLAAAGARVLATDLHAERVERFADEHGGEPVASGEELLGRDLDVLAPCAAGGLVDEEVAAAIDCRVVCGAANNPLSSRSAAHRLAAREVLYVPDFLANCGGLIHVDAERRGAAPAAVAEAVERAMTHLDEALAVAGEGWETPVEAAERQALERVERVRRAALAAA